MAKDKYIFKKIDDRTLSIEADTGVLGISIPGLKFGVYQQMPHGNTLRAAADSEELAERIADMLNGYDSDVKEL